MPSLSANGIDLYYELDGTDAPLLLLHGMGGSHEDWVYAGRSEFVREYSLILPDARGHGASTNPLKTITHKQCALDAFALLDHLGVQRCRAIGMSLGGNTLLHMATQQPERIEAMVLVSATMYFPEQARKIMSQVLVENQPPEEWAAMRQRHKLGDQQIRTIWEQQRALKDSYDDVSFTPPQLSRITAPTLIVFGDRDPLYPVEMAIEMYRAIPRSSLWIVPGGGHGPVFVDAAAQFVQTTLAFFRNNTSQPRS